MKRSLAAAATIAALASPVAGQTTERIVAFGDSLTFGVGDDPGRGGYPARLAGLLTTPEKTFNVENAGVSGEKSAEGLSRIAKIQGAPGDSLILMEGTNDTFADISTETTIANLIAMVSRAKSRGFGTVYLATVTPIGVTSSGNRFFNSINLADAIRQAAFEENFPNPDPHQGMYDLPNLYDDFYSGDGIHPNAEGYDELAEIFADFLEGIDNIAPAPSFVTPRNGSTGVPNDTLLQVILFDPISGIDLDTATLMIDGTPVPTTVTGDSRRAQLRAQPGNITGKRSLGVDVRDKALPVNRRVDTVSIFTAVGTSFLTGDLDQSGRVDGADLVRFAFSFGARTGDGRFRREADFDSNGVVDGSDLAQLAANFGRSSF